MAVRGFTNAVAVEAVGTLSVLRTPGPTGAIETNPLAD